MQVDSLGRQLRRGATWSTVNSVLIRLGTFLMGIIAARLLAPEEFGVFAVALTAHAILLNISDLGVSAYLVRYDGEPGEIAPTLMTVALGMSLLLAAPMALAAPEIARLLGSEDAAGPIRVLSITVVLGGVSAVPNGLLTRYFQQKKRFAAESCSFVVSNAVLVLLAVLGTGALALAWSRVAGFVASTIAFYLFVPRRYMPSLDMAQLRPLLRFGLPLAGSTLLGFTILNADYVVIGRMLGPEPLGLYYLAYNIAGWPLSVMSPVLASVGVAGLARVVHHRDLELYLANATCLVMAVAAPISGLLAVLATPLIVVVYGEQWRAAAVPLSLVAIYGSFRVLIDLLSNAGIALGSTRTLFACQVLYGVTLIPAMVLAVGHQGIAGAAIAHLVVMTGILLPCYLVMLRRGAGIRWLSVLRAVLPPAAAAAAASAAALVTSTRFDGDLASLLVGGGVGLTVYVALIFAWFRQSLASFRRLWGDLAAENAVPAQRRPATRVASV